MNTYVITYKIMNESEETTKINAENIIVALGKFIILKGFALSVKIINVGIEEKDDD